MRLHRLDRAAREPLLPAGAAEARMRRLAARRARGRRAPAGCGSPRSGWCRPRALHSRVRARRAAASIPGPYRPMTVQWRRACPCSGKFVVLSLLATVLLAVVVGSALHERIERRALENAAQLTRVIGDLTIAPRLDRDAARGDLRRAGPALARRRDRAGVSTGEGAGPPRQPLHPRRAPRLLRRPREDRPVAFSRQRPRRVRGRHALPGRARQDDDGARPRRRRSRSTCRCGSPATARSWPCSRSTWTTGRRPPPSAGTRGRSTCCSASASALLWLSLFTLVGRASRQLREQATRDPLTGLPNRTSLYRAGATAPPAPRAPAALVGLLLIDLDRFKEVNDTLGHDQGDTLLREVAARLGATLRRGDTLARLGGDEFAVLLRRSARPRRRGGARAAAARRARAAVRASAASPSSSAPASASRCAPTTGPTSARSSAAPTSRCTRPSASTAASASTTPSATRTRPERLQRVGELRAALAEGELVLHYQPKVDVAAGEVTGVEALVRWQHPELGLLRPAEFLPLAERTGMMGDLTRWVRRRGAGPGARVAGRGDRGADRDQPRRREHPRRGAARRGRRAARAPRRAAASGSPARSPSTP